MSQLNRTLLSNYIIQYQEINRHIRQLQEMSNDVTDNIVQILSSTNNTSGTTNNNNNNASTSTNTNTNTGTGGYNTYRYSSSSIDNPLLNSLFNTTTNTSINDIIQAMLTLNTSGFTNTNTNINTVTPETVSPFPSTEEITRATRSVMFCELVNPVDTRCPISLTEFNQNDTVIQIIPCGHIFQ